MALVDHRSRLPAISSPTIPTSTMDKTPSRRSMTTDVTATARRHAQTRESVGADRVTADAGGQKRAGERAGEKDSHECAERRTIDPRNRREEHDPAVGHQCAISDDEENRHADPPKIGPCGSLDDRRGVGPPEDERGQQDRDDRSQHTPDASDHHGYATITS